MRQKLSERKHVGLNNTDDGTKDITYYTWNKKNRIFLKFIFEASLFTVAIDIGVGIRN